MAVYVALVYYKLWHEALISVKSPTNDMLSLKIIKMYPDQTFAKATQNKPCNATCGELQRKTQDWPSLTQGLMWEKQTVKALDKPTLKKELKILEGRKMTIYLPLVPCHFKDNVLPETQRI